MYNTRDERNKAILEMRLKGMTYTAIGKELGVSKQRVHQFRENYLRKETYGVRGKGFLIDDIVYKGIYDYFYKNKYESLTSFCKKITTNRGYVITFKRLVTGERDSRINISTIKKICKVIGEPFEVVFALRKNMED